MATYIPHPALRGMEMGNQRSAQRLDAQRQSVNLWAEYLNRAAMQDRQQAYDTMRRQAEIAAGVGLPADADASMALGQSKPYFQNIMDYMNAGRNMRAGTTLAGEIIGAPQVPSAEMPQIVLPGQQQTEGTGITFGGLPALKKIAKRTITEGLEDK